jgi:hypothetical protein
MSKHIVQPGEHLARIASEHGFRSHESIWNHPGNSGLKKNRDNPNVLAPGDEIQIPDRTDKNIDRQTERRHKIRLKGKPLKLRLVVQDFLGEPVSDTDAVLQIDGILSNVRTDQDGLIELQIPHDAREGLLQFMDDKAPFTEPIPLHIGHLDPVDTKSGQIARLHNLGYFIFDVEPGANRDEKMDSRRERILRTSIEEFQCDHDLKVDGVCGPQTQKKLKEVHGS